MLQYLWNVLFKAKKISRLLITHQRLAIDGRFQIVGLGFGFRDKLFLSFVIPSFIASKVNVVVGNQLLDDLRDRELVALAGGADKIIVGDAKLFPDVLKDGDNLSACWRGSTPSTAAALTILMPCSSVPVKKNVSAPASR